MSQAFKRTYARVHGSTLELMEDIALPADQVVAVFIEMPAVPGRRALADAIEASAGAWTPEAHPDLASAEDVADSVRTLQAGFERSTW